MWALQSNANGPLSKLIEFDHKILNAEAAQATGCAAVLTVVDVMSQVTMFIPVVTKSAVHTMVLAVWGASSLLHGWGCKVHRHSHAGLHKKIMGVAHADISATDNPTHHAVVEHRNKVIGKMLDVHVAQSKGDLNSVHMHDLNMSCAAAATCNLQHTYNGHIVLRHLTGEIPCTQNDLVACAHNPAAAVTGSTQAQWIANSSSNSRLSWMSLLGYCQQHVMMKPGAMHYLGMQLSLRLA